MRPTRLMALVVLALFACPAVAGANPLGDLFRISDLPGDEGRGSAYDAQVEYNAGTSEYLVSWTADGIFGPSEDEVWVQRLSPSGAQLGVDRRISTIGPDGDTTREPFGRPAIAADDVNDRNLVVWSSDEANDEYGGSEFSIYGQLLGADGEEIGADDFEISGLQHGALYPDVAFNPGTAAPGDEEYLVVWTGEARRDPVQWGRRLDENGTPIGERVPVSQIAESGTGSLPQVAYNALAGEYLVAWYSFKPNEDGEAWGQRLATDGTEIGNDLLNLGPWVAARSDALEWLAVWGSRCPAGDGIPRQDLEILGRRVDAGVAPTGDGTCRLPGTPTPGPDPTPQPTPVGNPPPATPVPVTPAVPQPAPTPPPKLRAADVLKLPSTRRCVSRRRFRIRLRTPRGTRIARATVKVNGKRVRTVRGRRITAPVDLRGLPKGRFRVAIEVRTADGRKVTETRRYRTCVPRRRS